MELFRMRLFSASLMAILLNRTEVNRWGTAKYPYIPRNLSRTEICSLVVLLFLHHRMPTLAELVRRLIFVISCLVNEELPQLHEVTEHGQLNYNNALQDVQALLTQRRRNDILEILHQTMAGNFHLLERHERNIHHILNQFYNDRARGHASQEWPEWCYRITQNRNPLRQETSVHGTENGNIVVSDTEGATQNDERYRDVEARSRDQDMSHPSAHRSRDPQTSRRQANQRESPLPVLDDRALRSLLPQPSTPLENPLREEPRHGYGPWCNICGKNMETSPPVWSQIRDIIRELDRQQIQAFVTEINKCDEGILNSIQFHAIPDHEIVDALVRPLQRCHLRGQKCVLCLLNYVFQRIGRSDLANYVKEIQSRVE
ncbi:Hypothetical predicted protein [Paramuricea clavata]|uniref:Uncharacterized protein n=1 Tax=Paramuricea clavata TaxID=317549 RepID=A0A7D9K146_PARCT|nr:Hypothetical predicted protein [Paramuricea clavata]